jgi:Uma2 family endonuclease
MKAMGTVSTLLTFEEFERLPDRPGKRELLRGELIEVPPAESKHNKTANKTKKSLEAALDAAHARGEAQELGEVFQEMGYYLGADGWVQPDVSITHRDQPEGKYFEEAPAIAIEVISPGNTAEEMAIKTDLYFQHGAREVWRLYRKPRQISIDLPGGSRVLRAQDVLTTPLLPGFELRVDEILGD